ncbi:hypothetical protein [Nostoc sp. T09]|uniref:hypothetical protein n=1 Tax=Nostoc sp. T09 TaxID=1932621 RepID=UPI0015C4FA1D|nr:hypothetical protein [Nostoc sp. T09]
MLGEIFNLHWVSTAESSEAVTSRHITAETLKLSEEALNASHGSRCLHHRVTKPKAP